MSWIVQLISVDRCLDGAQVNVRNVALRTIVKTNLRNLSTGLDDLAVPIGISGVKDRLIWISGPNI